MSSGELKFAEKIVNFDENLQSVQSYIKENFNIDSQFNGDEMTLNIWSPSVNNSLQLLAAKQYIRENFDENMINIEYKKGDC